MVRLASINLNKGLRNRDRFSRLLHWLRENEVEILLVQEPSRAAPAEWQHIPGFRWLGGNEKVSTWVEERWSLPDAVQVDGFVQQLRIGYAIVYNAYLDAYSQATRAAQLRRLDELVSSQPLSPTLIVGDFNLAPEAADGLSNGAPSNFNSAVDREPFHHLLTRGGLVDRLSSATPEFTIERVIGPRNSQFRCDLALISDYWSPDISCRYSHAVRTKEVGFTDHSAILLDIPVELERSGGPEQIRLDLWDEPVQSSEPQQYCPEKTAMSRTGPSPVAREVTSKLVKALNIHTVLDYGCGRGADVRYYRTQGIEASGYDPHAPFGWSTPSSETFDLVTLVFVLNVLPDPVERIETIAKAAERVSSGGTLLVVARSPAEIDGHAQKSNWTRHNDGYWSSSAKGTFQKGISPLEIELLSRRARLTAHPLTNSLSFGPQVSHLLLQRAH